MLVNTDVARALSTSGSAITDGAIMPRAAGAPCAGTSRSDAFLRCPEIFVQPVLPSDQFPTRLQFEVCHEFAHRDTNPSAHKVTRSRTLLGIAAMSRCRSSAADGGCHR